MDMLDNGDALMKVKSSTEVRKLSSALYHNLIKRERVVLRTLGAGPTQQAMKAAAIVSGRLAQESKLISVVPKMHDVETEPGVVITALSFLCTIKTS